MERTYRCNQRSHGVRVCSGTIVTDEINHSMACSTKLLYTHAMLVGGIAVLRHSLLEFMNVELMQGRPVVQGCKLCRFLVN
jgi:hypothetical protein